MQTENINANTAPEQPQNTLPAAPAAVNTSGTALTLEGPAIILAAQPASLVAGCGWALGTLARAAQSVIIVIVQPAPTQHTAARQDAPEPGIDEGPTAPIAAQPTDCISIRFWEDISEAEIYANPTIERIATLVQESHANTVLAPTPHEIYAPASALGMAAREAVRRTTPCRRLVFYAATARPENIDGAYVQKRVTVSIPENALPHDTVAEPPPWDNASLAGLMLPEHYFAFKSSALLTPLRGIHKRRFSHWAESDRPCPLVSVITRTTNRAELAETLDSIAAQTYPNVEVVLVDASGDGSLPSFSHCGPFPLHIICQEKPLGRSSAANAGLDAAKGEFALFLDDDDWIHPHHLETLLETLTRSSDASAAYSQTACVTQAEAAEWQILAYYNRDYDPSLLLVDNFLPIHSVLFAKRSLADDLRFDESLTHYEDWDFWLQLSRRTTFLPTDHLTAVYRISTSSGFGQRSDDPVAPAAYRAVIAKWRPKWNPAELEQITRDAASHRRAAWCNVLRCDEPGADTSFLGLLNWNVDLRSQLKEQQLELHRHSDTMSAQRERIEDLLADINACHGELNEYKGQLRESSQERFEITQRQAALARRLAGLQGSYYWQITTPIRAIGSRWPYLLAPITLASKALWWTLTFNLPRRLRIRRAANLLLTEGLFDQQWYVTQYPDIVLRGLNPLLHWIIGGWKEQRWPNSLFDTGWYLSQHPDASIGESNPLEHFLLNYTTGECDPNPLLHCRWYLQQYPDVAAAKINPLTDYLDAGVRAGRNPNPLFDTCWYLSHNPDVATSGMNPLAHYLEVGAKEGRDPNPYFDTDWYCSQYPDVAESGINPLVHYLRAGAAEGRAPSATFDPVLYLKEHPEARRPRVNPLVHFLENRPKPSQISESHLSSTPAALSDPLQRLYAEMTRAAQREPRSEEYVPATADTSEATNSRVRFIAFYLPQFHPVPENDAWWGKGFTEWTNVSKAIPQFDGHYQPRLPDALGFYDLRLRETQQAQIDLAKRYGLYGFCYHYYWFGGRRILERPLAQMLEDKSLDFPFCVCWANENWTRRWDGCDEEVLLAQNHSPEDDLAFIKELEPVLRDSRYIRVDGRPLLLVYRAELFPDPRATAQRWRRYLTRQGMPDPYLGNVWSFASAADPRSIGFDAAIEFPPHQYPCHEVGNAFSFLNPRFAGRICDYNACVAHAESARYQPRPFELFPGVMTGWDNTPRRLESGSVYANATPEAYKRWLLAAGGRALDLDHPDKHMVFINAWNEWAEGTYLEPDRRFGYAYLQATKDALARLNASTARGSSAENAVAVSRARPRMLLVGHDAHPHGAQLLALNLARVLSRQFGYELRIWLLEGGELLPRFRDFGEVQLVANRLEAVLHELLELFAQGFQQAITNTVVTGKLVPQLKEAGFSVVSLVHEMPAFIHDRALQDQAQALALSTDHVVFAADTIRRGFATIADLPADRSAILPQGIYQFLTSEPGARASVANELGLPPDVILVLNIGYGDKRKGFDWFVECARQMSSRNSKFHFLWLGNLSPDEHARFERERRIGRLVTNLHHCPFTEQVARYISAADVFLLTSREDPFPSVVLEAIACGLPVVAFEGTGGHCELLAARPYLGALAAPAGDIAALAAALETVVAENVAHPERRGLRVQLAQQRFNFPDYAWALLRLLDPSLISVSVVVPNYNYAQYLQARLDSIFNQTYPVYEIIVLDDASTDRSIEILKEMRETRQRDLRIIENAATSGSVFKQWLKGVREARGEFVWIAEVDDLADSRFLERMVGATARHDETLFGFCDSIQIDRKGETLDTTYAAYCNEDTGLDFMTDFTVTGDRFLSEGIGVKNSVLNVSAVLFKRAALLEAFAGIETELEEWRISGDWRLYIELCRRAGSVVYLSEALNAHRRHETSVVGSHRLDAHIDEITRMHEILAATTPQGNSVAKRRERYLASLLERAKHEK